MHFTVDGSRSYDSFINTQINLYVLKDSIYINPISRKVGVFFFFFKNVIKTKISALSVCLNLCLTKVHKRLLVFLLSNLIVFGKHKKILEFVTCNRLKKKLEWRQNMH